MADSSKDFQINLKTTASGDGAGKVAADLEKIADAGKKVENTKFYDEEKIKKMEEDAAKAAQATENLGEKAHVSGKKVASLIGALSELSAAATGEGGAEHGLEKLGHLIAGSAFATGNVAVGVLITSVMDLWKAFSGGHGDHEKHIENLKKQATESEKTAEAMHKLADRAREFDAAQHDSGHWFDDQKTKIEALFKATETAIDRMMKLKSLMATTDKERIKLDEEQGKISHEDAAKQISAVEKKAAAEKFADEARKIAARATEIDAEQTALRSKSQQSHREQIEAEQRAKAAQDIADARKSNAERRGLVETEEKRFKEEHQKINEQEAIREETDPESHKSNERKHRETLKQIADENALKNQKAHDAVKRFGNLLPDDKTKPEDYAAKAEAAREKNVTEQRKIAEAQDKLANETAELIKKQKANLLAEQESQKQRDITEERAADAGRKKDQQEAEAKAKAAQAAAQKPSKDMSKIVHEDERNLKGAQSELEKQVKNLESNPEFKAKDKFGSAKSDLDEAMRFLAIHQGDAKGLQIIANTLKNMHLKKNGTGEEAAKALQQAVENEKAVVQILQQHTAELKSIKAQLDSQAAQHDE